MARGKQNTRKAPKAAPAARAITPEMLVEQGNNALASMELELAAEFYSRALTMSQNDTNIMDALADVKIQLGETEKALELLLTSTIVAPTVNPYKWFFLGQLQYEFDAVNSYRNGIKMLTEQLKTEADAEARNAMSKQIAKAHCSIAEIYLTDLCFEEDAEQTCEAEIAAAHQACPSSLDAQQTLASLRLSQNRKREAGDIITAVCDQVTRLRQVVAARTVVQEIAGAEEPAEFQDAPEMSFCIATLKLLIECASDPHHTALYVRAQELGSSLLEEDDENIELWYLMGVACMGGADCGGCADGAAEGEARGKKSKAGKKGAKKDKIAEAAVAPSAELDEATDLPAAQFHFETALEMMDKLKQQQREEEGPDAAFPYQQQYELIQEHLRMIAVANGGVAPTASSSKGAAGSAMPVDEEWSDDENGGEMAVDK